MAEVTQILAKTLGIKWKLHAMYRPQSSGKVGCMNRTLKTMLAKLFQETQLPWIDVLPLALLQAQCTPRASGYSPIKIRYGRPPPVIKRLTGDPQQTADLEMSNCRLNLGKIFRRMTRENLERTPIMLGNWVHPCQPGEMVWEAD